MKKNNTRYSNRIIVLLIFFIVLALGIIARLFYVQVIKSNEYSKMAIEQINRSEDLASSRGYILDRNNKKLAVNVAASTIYINPNYFGKDADLTRIKDQIATELAPFLEMSESDLASMISTERRVKIKQWVDREVAYRIRERNIQGVEIVDGFRRFYPFGTMSSHLLGFINVDGVGQYGVEAFYDKELAGTPGKILKSSDAGNRQLPTGDMEIFEADDGLSPVLTIDQGVQNTVEEEIKRIITEYRADGVNIIVQEVETGDILAMSSYPAFNPNEPTAAVSEEQTNEWKDKDREEIQNAWYKNWRNPNVSNIYEPGSTFKLITAAAAIEENTSNPNKQYYCTGYIRDIKNAPVLKCVSYEHPHGDITLQEALAKSCNPSFVYLNRDLGREKFLKYVNAFGFGDKTGVDLPGEGLGIIPKAPDDITEIQLATMSYGHGIAVTPIQLINAVSAIGNEGVLMKPRVVKEFVNSEGRTVKAMEISEKRQVISPETAKQMLDMMYNVVENGTATKAKSSMYKIGGKTGTANRVAEEGGYAQNQYVSSFVGLAPIDDPKIAVLVVVDNPKSETYGSIVAAPSAKNIIEYTLNSMGVSQSPRETIEDSKEFVRVPDVSNLLIGEAGRIITKEGLKYTTEYVDITEDTIVVGQKPKAGELVARNSIIELKIDLNNGEEKIIPSFLGKKLEEITPILERMGIQYDVNGEKEGVVVKQVPEPSEKIKMDEKMVITIGEETNHENKTSVDPSLVDGIVEETKVKEKDTETKEDNKKEDTKKEESKEKEDTKDTEEKTKKPED